ncbi:MAG: GNAT family N-acetyltransferase [Pseudomonadota bacterium]
MKRPLMTALKTRRLNLVPFTTAHAADVQRYSGFWEVARYTAGIPHPYPPGGADAFARDVEFDRRNGQGGLVFAIMRMRETSVVGLIDLNLTDDARSAEMGYALSPQAWGQGIASEAAKAVIDWGFSSANLDAIYARALVVNRASCRVLQKAGLRRIGHGYLWMPERNKTGLFEDYRLLRREWQA